MMVNVLLNHFKPCPVACRHNSPVLRSKRKRLFVLQGRLLVPFVFFEFLRFLEQRVRLANLLFEIPLSLLGQLPVQITHILLADPVPDMGKLLTDVV